MLKEVQTWEIFLQKLGLPDKGDITMYSRPFLRYCHCLNLILSKCTRVCFEKCIDEINSVFSMVLSLKH